MQLLGIETKLFWKFLIAVSCRIFYTVLMGLVFVEGVIAQPLDVAYSSRFLASELDYVPSLSPNCHGGNCRSSLSFSMPTKDAQVLVTLRTHEIRSAVYLKELSRDAGQTSEVALFRGTISGGDKRDFVRFALVRSERIAKLTGFIRYHSRHYSVSQNTPGSLVDLTVREITGKEMDKIVGLCAAVVPATLSSANSLKSPPVSEATALFSQLIVANIATEADYDFVQFFGGASAANAEIVAIMNAIDGIYEADLGVSLKIVYQHAWSNSDTPYLSSDSTVLLEQFQDYWEANIRPSHDYDVAHLWVGRALENDVAGIAYMDTVCSSYAYGLSSFLNDAASDIVLSAHEIGHNFGAGHDSIGSPASYIMYPYVVSTATHFSSYSKSEIASALTQFSCLSSGGGGGGGVVNRPPVLAYIGPKSAIEGQALQFYLSASDPDGDSLSYFSDNLPKGSSLNGRVFSYVPDYQVVTGGQTSRSFNVTFSVGDGRGKSDSETIVLSVRNINRGPVTNVLQAASGTEGGLFSYVVMASEPDQERLAFQAQDALPAGMTLNPDTGQLSWRPAGNQAGSYSLRIVISDPWKATVTARVNIQIADRKGVANVPESWTRGDYQGNSKAVYSVFRPVSGVWYSISGAGGQVASKQFGLPGDVPLIGDFNGDHITDYAVYRPTTGYWFIQYSGTGIQASVQFGLAGDIPVPGDFDGDGRTDFAIYRPGNQIFVYRKSSYPGATTTKPFGLKGDIPVICDYDGDRTDDLAVFRPSDSTWYVNASIGQSYSKQYGLRGDIPVPGYYKSSTKCDYGVWRPTTSQWFMGGSNTPISFGLSQDIPVVLDNDGDRKDNFLLWRREQGRWYWREANGSTGSLQLGLSSDIPVYSGGLFFALRNLVPQSSKLLRGFYSNALLYERLSSKLVSVEMGSAAVSGAVASPGSSIVQGDFDGDSLIDYAVFNAGAWSVTLATGSRYLAYWGIAGDTPVGGDYDGDGKTDLAVFRASDRGNFSRWYVLRSSDGLAQVEDWGLLGDLPLSGDYDGDGWGDMAVWRPTLGMWFVKSSRSHALIAFQQWGLSGDTPLIADLDRDGRVDFTVWRPASGQWYGSLSGGGSKVVQWGLPGDLPLSNDFFREQVSSYGVFRPSTLTLYVLSPSGNTAVVPLPNIMSQGKTSLVGVSPWGIVN